MFFFSVHDFYSVKIRISKTGKFIIHLKLSLPKTEMFILSS